MKPLPLLVAALCGAGVTMGVVRFAPASSAPAAAPQPAPAVPASPAPARPAEPRGDGPIQVAGVLVQRKLHAEQEYGEPLPFPGSFAHTRVALEWFRPEGGIVALQREDSTCTRFVDELGTDLLPAEAGTDVFEMMPEVSADGRSLAFVLGTEGHADARAQRVFASGEVAVLVASEQATEASATLALESGATLKVGPFSFEVGEVGGTGWNDGWTVELKSQDDLSAIVTWSLVDADGNEHPLRPSMSWRGMGTWSQTLECEAAQERAALRLTYWSDARTERVPFDVSAQVGLK